MTQRTFIFKAQSEDRPGIISALSAAIFQAGGNIDDAQHFNDPISNRFFSRMIISIDSTAETRLRNALESMYEHFGMVGALRDQQYRPKVLIMASKFDHCLGELLYRVRSQELKIDVVGVASNYTKDTYENVLTAHEIPFFYCPITPETKKQQEQKLRDIIHETGAELVVLARYMQILSDEFSADLEGRCINIHHSFLPGFKGAKPYHQAYDRGVKLIGATAHYVTADLDEGPIIEQNVERVSHHDTPEMLVQKGAEIERRVLARAVRYHIEDRVMVNGHRTVVFAD
ncbi:TPA: formyltetrahydrofolate deformylase [Pseudomonas aeruginosa]